jgi:LemA protein
METESIILVAVIIAVIVMIVVIYFLRSSKKLKRMKNELDKDWSDIEFLFKQRQDELPRLVQTSRSYMPEEKKVLDSVAAARALYQRATTREQKAIANAVIGEKLQDLLTAAGKHPGLQNDNSFGQVQARISEIEERITERCDLYNQDVNRFNRSVSRFPTSISARLASLKPRQLYEVEARDKRRETS